MENETQFSPRSVLVEDIGVLSATMTPSAPGVQSRPRAVAAPAPDGERTGVFTSLVREDGDIAGLVAYSIYKQNKLDWLQAFEAAKGRVPVEAEVAAYIIGESTPRRLATYRHLAEATLAGTGPEPSSAGLGRPLLARDKGKVAGLPPRSVALAAVCAVLAVAVIVAFWLAAHYTLTAR
jgi:hypothetical protein